MASSRDWIFAFTIDGLVNLSGSNIPVTKLVMPIRSNLILSVGIKKRDSFFFCVPSNSKYLNSLLVGRSIAGCNAVERPGTL